MSVNEISIQVTETGTVLKYWYEGSIKTMVFTDTKKLLAYIDKLLKGWDHG